MDVARRAGASQDLVSRIERGQVDAVTVGKLRRILAALDAELVLHVRWRGGALDRLLDEGHAALVGAIARLLESLGWDVRIEVSFAIYGEHGSIDLLAWHLASQTLLVVEIKTEITSVEETLRRHDAKVRLGPRIAGERFGWKPGAVARLLVLPASSTERRRIARHEAIFARAYPVRGADLRRWLRQPGATGGLIFLSSTHGVRGIHHAVGRKRVRRSRPNSARAAAPVRARPEVDSTHGVRR